MVRRRQLDEAIRICRAGLETAPTDDALWQIQAVCLAEQGKHSEALISIDRALDAYPENAYCWSIKSSILANDLRYSEAIECDDRAIALDPKNPLFREKKQSHVAALKSRAPKRILIVDDEVQFRLGISEVLTNAGYVCRAVAGGVEALALLESQARFDLLIHDLLNPELDGFSLLLRAKRAFPALQVIVATAIDDDDAERSCLENGAFSYLRKPLQIEHLLESVSRALNSETSR